VLALPVLVGLVTAALPATVLASDVRPALSPTTNSSIVLYKPPANGKPGRAVTGVFAGGVFVRKSAFSTRRWTSIAVGRDSMAFYDKGTGKLLTGKFRNGIWKPLKSRTIAKGYTHVVASCDTILFYKRPTRTGKTAEFAGGDIRDMRNMPSTGDDIPLMAASCDTLITLGDVADGLPGAPFGWLRLGHVEFLGSVSGSPTHLTANRTSAFRLEVPDAGLARGQWDRIMAGEFDGIGFSDGFGRWDIIAGAGDSILFYMRSTGVTGSWLLLNGDPTDTGPVTGVGKGWRIIAGGK
jgi:hypothetical protein